MLPNGGRADVFAVEIHDREVSDGGGRYLSFDLADVLAALGPWTREADWLVTDYEPTGFDHEGAEADRAIAQNVFNVFVRAPGSPAVVRLSGREMETLARGTTQTIDGVFIAIPADSGRDEEAAMSDLSSFASSRAAAVIKAIDSSLFFVATKKVDDAEALRGRFTDVREADVAMELGIQAD
jgi:hypothetical protein